MTSSHKKKITAIAVLVTLQLSIGAYTLIYYSRNTRHQKETPGRSSGNPEKLSRQFTESSSQDLDPKNNTRSDGQTTHVTYRPRTSREWFEDYPHAQYVRIKNESQKFDINCDVCAVVSSSGQLLGTQAGDEIDSATCVIRMNIAPTKGYEADVGTRTTVRIVGFLGITQGHYTKSEFFEREGSSQKIVVWTSNNRKAMKKESIKIMKDHPGLDMYIATDEHMRFCEELFKEETGKTRVESKSWLSTGWFTMIFALKNCEQIKVYGMIEHDHCQKNQTGRVDVPYHYYGKKAVKECDVSNAGEIRGTGGHRYMTEKFIFGRWANFSNLSFYHPSWNITNRPQDKPSFLRSMAGV